MTTTLQGRPWTFELLGGRLCLDFANSVSGFRGSDDVRDRLQGYPDLVSWARQAGALDEASARRLLATAARHPAQASAAFAEAIALREAIYQVFFARALGRDLPAAPLALIDAALRSAQSNRRLIRGDTCCSLAWDFGTDLAAPIWPVAVSAAELLTAPAELARLRVCGLHQSGECAWLFIDETKAGTRRWCSMKDCGNRAKARRHAARVREVGRR